MRWWGKKGEGGRKRVRGLKRISVIDCDVGRNRTMHTEPTRVRVCLLAAQEGNSCLNNGH